MKKLIVATIILSSSLYAQNNVTGFRTTNNPVKFEGTTETVILSAREELKLEGYSADMMNDLFGDENMYFPATDDKLAITLYVVDKLIENGQYLEIDRAKLIALSNEAYTAFKNCVYANTSVHTK